MFKKKDYYEEFELEVCCEKLAKCEQIDLVESYEDDYCQQPKLFWYVNCGKMESVEISHCPFCGQKLKEKK
jgi:hypothetical protein